MTGMPSADAMTDSEISELRGRCTSFLHGHGPEKAADLLATIPPDTEVDTYGDGGVVTAFSCPAGRWRSRPCYVRTPTGAAGAPSSFTRCAIWSSTKGKATGGCIS